MDRYIECKTQEQWNIVKNKLNLRASTAIWDTYKEDTVLLDKGNKNWEYCSRSFYENCANYSPSHFTTFEEFCKQEGINMKKKSTDYCFILKETDDYPVYSKKYGYDLRGNCPGLYYYPVNEDNLIWYAESTKPDNKQVIAWQEFKQLFIDKTMTTQEEINELKTRLQELEEKYKKENEFKVGDIRVALEELSYCEKGSTFCITKITGRNPKDNVYYSHSKDEDDYIDYEDILKHSRKATQAEINEYLAKNKPIEISGYKAEFNKANKTVSFGCKKDITKKDLEAILTVMKLNEKFDEYFTIGEEIIASQDKEDFTEEVTKETIQKLIDKLEE